MLSSPCNLSKYLKTWGVKEKKSIFPHGRYGSVEEMKIDLDFPNQIEFNSSLSSSKVSDEDYFAAKEEYYRRKKLPAGHPEKISNMLDWLKAGFLK